ncbi:MAG: cyclic nucleotide-binding domain-containing protein [Pseudomonadota bacterium]
MAVNLRKLKDQAAHAVAEGEYERALELLLAVLREDRGDHGSRQRLGDLYRKLGRDQDAVAAYQAVVGGYAAEGRLAKAIALCTIILQIDPRHDETQRTLAELYGRKSGAPLPTPLPATMAQSLQPSVDKVPAAMIRGRRASKINLPVARISIQTAAAPAPAASPAVSLPGKGRTASGSIEIDLDLDLVEEAPAPRPSSRVEDAVSEMDIIEETLPTPATTRAAAEPTPVMDAPPAKRAEADAEFEIDDVLADEEAIEFDEAFLAPASSQAVVVLDDSVALEPVIEVLPDEPGPSALGLDPAKLPGIPLFEDLPKNAFIDLLQKLKLRDVVQGEILVRAGERGDTLAIIASGTVRVEKPRPDGSSIPLARLREGEFFGEMALLGDGIRTADVIAESDGELLEIDKRTLTQIAKKFPSVRSVLARFYKAHLLGQLFKTSSLFLPFDPPTRKQLFSRFKQLTVTRGQAILEEGKKGDGLYVLVSGRCEVSREESGLRIVLAELGEGDIFGEVSLLTGQPAMATVKALRKCTVLKLPRPTFREVIMTHPQILELVSALSDQRQAMSAEVLGEQPQEQVKQWL